MDILGIGPLELILILVIALVFFGPDKLPEIGAKLGKGLRDMRRATREFSQEIDQARQAIENPIQEIKAPLDELKQPLQEIGQPLQEIKATAAVLGEAAKGLQNPTQAIRDSVMKAMRPEGGSASEAAPAKQAEQADTASPHPADVDKTEPESPAAADAAEEGPGPEVEPRPLDSPGDQPGQPGPDGTGQQETVAMISPAGLASPGAPGDQEAGLIPELGAPAEAEDSPSPIVDGSSEDVPSRGASPDVAEQTASDLQG